jgi:hypothetical protein
MHHIGSVDVMCHSTFIEHIESPIDTYVNSATHNMRAIGHFALHLLAQGMQVLAIQRK